MNNYVFYCYNAVMTEQRNRQVTESTTGLLP